MSAAGITPGSAAFSQLCANAGSTRGCYVFSYHRGTNFPPRVRCAEPGSAARRFLSKKLNTPSSVCAGFLTGWRRIRFVINAVYPAAYYAARWLREAGIPTVGMCHGMLSFYEGLLDQFVLTRTAYQVSALVCVSTWLQHDVLQRRPDGVLVRNIPCGIPISETVAKKPYGRLRLA
jgi:glycosyl transferase family 4